MRIAYLDCFAGISGDMFLGALLDAGVPRTVLASAVASLALDASLGIESVDRSGISSTKVHVFEGDVVAESAQTAAGAPGPAHVDMIANPLLAEHVHSGAHSHDHPHSPKNEQKQMRDGEHSHQHAHEHSHAHSHSHDDGHEHSHSHDDGHEHSHSHSSHSHGRSLTRIRELIYAAPLAPPVQHFAVRAFELLGQSEAKIHNVPVDEVHFHEVGAVDAIVDIVAASAGIHYLSEQSPVTWFCSNINVGSGMVQCAHGTFPVPAPATADLLRGFPTYSAHIEKELATPTGAALLRALAPSFGPQPAMRVHSIGYGAGSRNPQGFPNVLRLSLGDTEDEPHGAPRDALHRHSQETVVVVEAAIDDANPQLLAEVAERALEAGALDCMLTPVVMKKGRAATLITLLGNPEDAPALERLLLRETTTLGIRTHREHRTCLDRRYEAVETPFGEIRMKIGSLQGEDFNAAPEFEDCRKAASAHAVPVKRVLQAALASYLGSKTMAGAR